MRSVVALLILGVAFIGGCNCGGPTKPTPPIQCDVVSGSGCLPDETCNAGVCEPLGRCEGDSDCPSVAYACVFPAQFCELRPGFAEECSDDAPCDAGFFCALGRCRAVDETTQTCATRLDCRPGFMCDKRNSLCIEDAPCTFAEQGFPEAACDPEETCDASGVCRSSCQGLCTPETEEDDCGAEQRCGPACTCVQCLLNADCGAGLICNTRNGRCQAEGLCFSDDDCDDNLECGRSGLCELPPPPCSDDFDCAIAEFCNLQSEQCELLGGECFDDRFEESDTPSTARELALVAGVPKTLDELVLCPDDDDVFSIALTAGDRLTIQTDKTEPTSRATIWLLDSDAETSVGFAETPPRGNGELTYTAQETETVYLRLNALLATSPYAFTATLTSGAPCAADFFETSNGADNNAIASATPPALTLFNVNMSAGICRGDVDFYAVDLEAGEGVLASVGFDTARSDLDVAIVDSAGVVLVDNAGTAQPAIVQRRLTEGGRVYVRVRGFGNSFGPYTLRLTRLAPVGCVDAVEATPDDSAPRVVVAPNVDSAAGPAPLTERRGLCIGGALGDVDRWSVSVREFERLSATAVPVEPGLRLRVRILGEDGVERTRSAVGDDAATAATNAVADEVLIVEVSSPQGQIGAYDFTLLARNQDQCPIDDGEPNNTVATRSALPAATDVVSICESDEDFYVLRGERGKKVTIDLTFRHGDGDLDVQLLGLDGRQIIATSDGSSDNEQITATLPLEGDYTIRVFSLSSGANVDYFIDAVLSSPDL